MKNHSAKRLGSCFLLIFTCLVQQVTAQKLPNVQISSLRAPEKMKVDGKPLEWATGFQAYNKAVSAFYTISNDDANLYLALYSQNKLVITKILFGGITVTLNSSGKKDKKTDVSVTYPNIGNWLSNSVIGTGNRVAAETQYSPGFNNRPAKIADTAKYKLQTDSFINTRNKQMTSKFKQIGISGFRTIQDSILSVYNDEGIRVAALLDGSFGYTYEMAVPLKHLGMSTTGSGKLYYNICLNGAGKDITILRVTLVGNNERVFYTTGNMTIPVTGPRISEKIIPTDFSGEYFLAKK